MKAFNIEAGRLNKWIKSPQEACEEFGIDAEKAQRFFGANIQIEPKKTMALLGV